MSNKKIALVDDEEVFHWITKQFIGRVDSEIQVMSFYNGREAIEHLSAKKDLPDMILLDINMPIANGWVFLDQYVENLESLGIPIFVVSSSIDPEDQRKANSYECVKDFISKPLDVATLNKILKD